MLKLGVDRVRGRRLQLLCIGAHSDDLEIGCGGSVLAWISAAECDVCWVVLSAEGKREQEARRSANALLRRASSRKIVLHGFRDGYFPASHEQLKNTFEALKPDFSPDLVLTHRLDDRHQDHRLVAELTWNTFRDHLILEYEIPKYEGDLGQPNLFVPIPAPLARRKAAHLQRYFGSQRSKYWFRSDNFLALARLRGMECRAASGFAEAFHARKIVLAGAVSASD